MSEFIVSTPIASILGRSVVVTDMSNGIANSYCHAQALPMSQKWAAILGMRIADPICAYPKSTTELVVCVSVVGANDKPPMIALFLTASPASLVGVVVDESGISDASAHLAMAKKMVDRLDAVDRSLCP